MSLILVDMDGVLADLETLFWELWDVAYDETVPRRDQADHTQFYIEEQIGMEWAEHVDAIMQSEGFFASIPPMEDAIEGIWKLASSGHDVWICTSPIASPYCATEKWGWVYRYLGEDWTRRMIIAKDKTMIRGDWLIDDKPVILGAMPPTWQQVFYDQPYNRSRPEPHRMTWADYLDGKVTFL